MSPTPTAEAVRSRRWWILAVLCLSVLLVTIDNTIVNVALPTLSRELSATTSQLQWVVDAYTLTFAGLLLVAGNLGDRLGRRRVLQVGLVLFALTSLGAVLAGTVEQLIAARAAMGVAAALIYPATLALLTNVFTDARERATAIGIWSGVSGLAVALGPVSGGILLQHFSWGSVFLVNVPVALVALAAGWWLLPESRHAHDGRFDVAGALLSVAGVTVLVWSLIEAPDHGWTSLRTLGGLVVAAALIAAFVGWELRRRHPLFDVRLFANPRFSAASASIALAFFGLFGFIFMITQYFQAVRGYDTLRAGVATLPFALVTGVMSPVAIMVMKRVGTKVVVTAGMALMSAGFLVAAGSAVDSAVLGSGRPGDVPDGVRAGADGRAGDRRDHGRSPAVARGRRVRGERHHPRGGRDARRRRRRVGAGVAVRLAPGRLLRAARPAACRDRRGRPVGGRRARCRAAAARGRAR